MNEDSLRRRAALVAWKVLLERSARADSPLDLEVSGATGKNAWIMADIFLANRWEPKKP